MSCLIQKSQRNGWRCFCKSSVTPVPTSSWQHAEASIKVRRNAQVSNRRLFNFVENSIEYGTQWVVFEPNDMDLWERVKRDASAFLTRVWSSGALFGLNPDEAFYVKCDEELNPPEVRDVGQLIVEVGLAPVKPAEFVVFRISQFSGTPEA